MTTTAENARSEIVVIDDDPDFRELVIHRLRRSGFRVTGLRDGRDAASFIAGRTLDGRVPAAVVTDIRMPGFDGVALLQAIREAGWTTPVILMTGFGVAGAREIDRLDAVAVLSKPFDMAELESLLATSIGVPYGLEHTA